MSDEKKRLRVQCRDTRRGIASGDAEAAARSVARRVTTEIPLAPSAVVAGYWPFPDELDPRPVMTDLHAQGHVLCLPVVVAPHSALEFRAWAPGDSLVKAVFGTRVPHSDRLTLVPDVLLVPLLAFDRAGFRLGYGGGYYDRTLAALEPTGAISIGIGFAIQEIKRVPRDAYDRRLNWMVTETGTYQIA